MGNEKKDQVKQDNGTKLYLEALRRNEAMDYKAPVQVAKPAKK